MPPRRSHRHSPVSPGIMDSPTGSPTHDQSHQLIQRACTQPDLASYGLRIQSRQSVPSDLKYRSDPRQSPRSSLPYDRQYDSSSSPQRQLVPRVSAPARGHFSIGKLGMNTQLKWLAFATIVTDLTIHFRDPTGPFTVRPRPIA